MMGMLFLWWLAASVVVGFVCTVAGGNKGVGGIRWFVLALLIGPFALIAVAAMPDLKTRRILRLIAEKQGVPEDAFGEVQQAPETSEPTDLYPKLK